MNNATGIYAVDAALTKAEAALGEGAAQEDARFAIAVLELLVVTFVWGVRHLGDAMRERGR